MEKRDITMEFVGKLFNDFLWKLSAIQKIDADMELKLKLSFQEGFIRGMEIGMDGMKRMDEKLKDIMKPLS